ncbi:MAG: hypothetical protein KF734_08270 [Saprospiraceae bacterium]|nr:hypothetical protein [Saprospiraceae bacterium]MCW5922983.1 hypothetical protein [Saprospiraceae bacterium]
MRPILILTLLVLFACRSEGPDTIPLPTKICIKTTHHDYPLTGSFVYLKYFTDTFPGYDKKPSYFDAFFVTGADARGCIESVPEGRHWLVAFGYDSLHYPHEAFGSLPVEISLDHRPVIDTMLYLGH